MNFAGETFAERAYFFDDDALEAEGEKLLDWKLAALAFHGDDDAMNRLRAFREALECVDPDGLALGSRDEGNAGWFPNLE